MLWFGRRTAWGFYRTRWRSLHMLLHQNKKQEGQPPPNDKGQLNWHTYLTWKLTHTTIESKANIGWKISATRSDNSVLSPTVVQLEIACLPTKFTKKLIFSRSSRVRGNGDVKPRDVRMDQLAWVIGIGKPGTFGHAKPQHTEAQPEKLSFCGSRHSWPWSKRKERTIQRHPTDGTTQMFKGLLQESANYEIWETLSSHLDMRLPS